MTEVQKAIPVGEGAQKHAPKKSTSAFNVRRAWTCKRNTGPGQNELHKRHASRQLWSACQGNDHRCRGLPCGGRFTFDGRGNLTGKLFVRVAGINMTPPAFTGTYSVAPDCTVTDSWGPPINSTHVARDHQHLSARDVERGDVVPGLRVRARQSCPSSRRPAPARVAWRAGHDSIPAAPTGNRTEDGSQSEGGNESVGTHVWTSGGL